MDSRPGEQIGADTAADIVAALAGELPGRVMLETLRAVVPELAKALGPDHEVVVHDISRIPNSIIAIGGTVTGRSVGGPITDLLLRALRQGETDSIYRYQARTTDGRLLSSSTVFIKDPDGSLVGCLCVNRDITELVAMGELYERVTGAAGAAPAAPSVPVPAVVPAASASANEPRPAQGPAGTREIFAPTVDDLAVTLVSSAIADTGVPIDLMQKRHKVQIVTELDARGLFLLRDAVDLTATMLQVSRESVYGYLKESRGGTDTEAARPRRLRGGPKHPARDR